MSKKSSAVIFVVVAFIIVAGITFAFNSKTVAPTQPVVETPSTPSTPATTPTQVLPSQ